ncbi:MAG: 50S ribosomal protein L23 [Patescibacteria group bacterium]
MGILEVFKKSKKTTTPDKAQKVVKNIKKSVTKEVKVPTVKVVAEKKAGKPDVSSQKSLSKLSKGDAHLVVIRPLVTEKTADLGALNQYTFEVSVRTNKTEVKKAIFSLYNVMPVQIRIINKPGKIVRRGRYAGVTKKWKKAIVTLTAGDKIEFFTGV